MTRLRGTGLTAGHFRSGLFSLDWALADRQQIALGPPTLSIYELYGKPSTGKNTLAFYLAGKLDTKGKVAYCALEGFNRDYIKSAMEQAGHVGELVLIDNMLEPEGVKFIGEVFKENGSLLSLQLSGYFVPLSILNFE